MRRQVIGHIYQLTAFPPASPWSKICHCYHHSQPATSPTTAPLAPPPEMSLNNKKPIQNQKPSFWSQPGGVQPVVIFSGSRLFRARGTRGGWNSSSSITPGAKSPNQHQRDFFGFRQSAVTRWHHDSFRLKSTCWNLTPPQKRSYLWSQFTSQSRILDLSTRKKTEGCVCVLCSHVLWTSIENLARRCHHPSGSDGDNSWGVEDHACGEAPKSGRSDGGQTPQSRAAS